MVHLCTAVVIGSGQMGAAIAAHLANAGVDCLLLDLVPTQLTVEESAAGLNLSDPPVRNRFATQAIAKLKRTNPPPLYDESFAERITPGNVEDHLDRVARADWVIEAIVERLDAKRALFTEIEKYWRPGTIVSTNTSGISVDGMSTDRGLDFRKHFLGTHFFNPPRYMKLVELIPGRDTAAAVVDKVRRWCERNLGKGVVIAKDTPNFIANRIGVHGLLVTLREMESGGFTVEEVDAVTGPALGRPKSATFRTLDLVGLDTFVHVANNVYERVDDEAERSAFLVPNRLQRMVENGWLGEKSGRGFYWKRKSAAGSAIYALDLDTMDYQPQRKPSSPALEAAKAARGAAAKIKALIGDDAGNSGSGKSRDRYSVFAWRLLALTLIYAAEKVGEIADTVRDIDHAMKWGFNWELGPFEVWEALGLAATAQRMEADGMTVPAWVKERIAAGHTSFYSNPDASGVSARVSGIASAPASTPSSEPASTIAIDAARGQAEAEVISLAQLKEAGKTIVSNPGASLIDLGDGIACLEFHSRSNAIGEDILRMIHTSLDEVERHYDGLVIANQGRNFCVGANLMLLLMEAQDEEWDEIDHIIRMFQSTMQRMRRFVKPIVAAPHRMTLGGGVEVCMPADRVVAAAETYGGLVETGVGLIPAGGGCMEMAHRASQRASQPETDLQPYLNEAFTMIGMAKVSTSGHHAIRMGLFRPEDRIVIHPDHLIHEAKKAALHLVQEGGVPGREASAGIRVAGAAGKAVLQLGAYGMRQSGYISDHDLLIANKLAHVLAGGDVPAGTRVTEQYLLDLEREAFLSLCGEPKTQARMQHMLANGKPLRN